MPRSPLFHAVAGTPYKAADPDTRLVDLPDPDEYPSTCTSPDDCATCPRCREIERRYARAEAAAAIVKAARKWRVCNADNWYETTGALDAAIDTYNQLGE